MSKFFAGCFFGIAIETTHADVGALAFGLLLLTLTFNAISAFFKKR